MNPEAMLAICNLCKRRGTQQVLDDVNFEVGRGEVVALLGPNGAGKTTLVHILATLTAADSGSVRVAGHELPRQARAVRRSIGVAGQFATVDEVLTGRENLAIAAQLAGIPRAARDEAIAREAERFDLGNVMDSRASTYSGGTRRRLDIAMSLIAQPLVVLLDEPSVGLDPRSRDALWFQLRGLASEGVAILLTTQYLEEADRLADRIIFLEGGRVIASGTPSDLKRRIGASRLTVRYTDGGSETRSTDATLADVRAKLDRISDAARPVQAVEITPPSLDDVFLSLTRHKPTTEAA